MITFTKEQLIASAHARIEFAEMMLAGELEPLKERTWSIELELARIALASLEAEAVAYTDAEELRFPHATSDMWPVPLGHGMDLPLYTAPPAPVSVPDGIDKWQAIDDIRDHDESFRWDSADGYEAGWNACRAAMLQGAYGNSPDGWVACSERMPNIGVPVITCCGDVVQYAAYAWDGKAWQDWYEEYDKLPANTFTHWHPRPAAPQQEVTQALAKGMERYGDAMQELAKKEEK